MTGTEQRRLVSRIAILERMEALDAPEIILEEQRRLVQQSETLAEAERVLNRIMQDPVDESGYERMGEPANWMIAADHKEGYHTGHPHPECEDCKDEGMEKFNE